MWLVTLTTRFAVFPRISYLCTVTCVIALSLSWSTQKIDKISLPSSTYVTFIPLINFFDHLLPLLYFDRNSSLLFIRYHNPDSPVTPFTLLPKAVIDPFVHYSDPACGVPNSDFSNREFQLMWLKLSIGTSELFIVPLTVSTVPIFYLSSTIEHVC